ncbi:MAG: hypothetical protein Q7U88_00040 [Desulfocapsaceae bacterium]|nr:hypothetical protein [Desulfocapsaceae bacterium]
MKRKQPARRAFHSAFAASITALPTAQGYRKPFKEHFHGQY